MDKLYRDLTLATQSEKYDSVHLMSSILLINVREKMQAQPHHQYYHYAKRKLRCVNHCKGNDPVLDENQRLEIEAFLT
jgi:isoleucyl-tRNA synthetase